LYTFFRVFVKVEELASKPLKTVFYSVILFSRAFKILYWVFFCKLAGIFKADSSSLFQIFLVSYQNSWNSFTMFEKLFYLLQPALAVLERIGVGYVENKHKHSRLVPVLLTNVSKQVFSSWIKDEEILKFGKLCK